MNYDDDEEKKNMKMKNGKLHMHIFFGSHRKFLEKKIIHFLNSVSSSLKSFKLEYLLLSIYLYIQFYSPL